MLSGTYGIGKNFGMSFKNYNESGFQSFARSISEPVSKCGGLYMPVLISKDTFIESGGFPEGNIYADGIGTCNGPVTKSGDAYYFYDVLEAKFGIKHVTAFDSIVYHMQCGEMHE